MNDVFTLAVFAAKVLCLIVFVIRPEAGWQHRRRLDADEPHRLHEGVRKCRHVGRRSSQRLRKPTTGPALHV